MKLPYRHSINLQSFSLLRDALLQNGSQSLRTGIHILNTLHNNHSRLLLLITHHRHIMDSHESLTFLQCSEFASFHFIFLFSKHIITLFLIDKKRKCSSLCKLFNSSTHLQSWQRLEYWPSCCSLEYEFLWLSYNHPF